MATPTNRRSPGAGRPRNTKSLAASLSQDHADDSATDAAAEFEAIDVETIDVSSENSPFDDVTLEIEDAPEKPRKTVGGKPKTGAPSVDEWQDFIGRIVLTTLTDFYLDYALKGISDQLTDRELRQVRLSKQDLKDMAAPIATLAQGSKFAAKRGRALIAASDSIEAIIVMVLWMKKVNKIAKKYRPQRAAQPRTVRGNVVPQPQQNSEEMNYGTPGQFQEQGPGDGAYGPGVGGFPLINPGTG